MWPISNMCHVSSPHDVANILHHSYESNMESSEWNEIINLIMNEEEQVVASLHGPLVHDYDANSQQDHTLWGKEDHQIIIDKKQCSLCGSAKKCGQVTILCIPTH